jgi:multidrug efflux system membrane fusion protein
MAKAQRSRWCRAIWIIFGLAIVVGVSLVVRHIASTVPASGRNAAAPAAMPVTAATASRQDMPDIIDAIGTVQSIDSVSVQPRVSGTIEKIEFTPGQYLNKGQELFLIDPRPYQAVLDQAKGQLVHDQGVLAQARMDLQRYQTLAQKRSIAAQTAQDQVYVVQQNEAMVQLDQANVEMAQLNLDYCHIVSPISGRAGMLQVDLGNLVGPASAQPNNSVNSRPSASPSLTASPSPSSSPAAGAGSSYSPSANTGPSVSPSANASGSYSSPTSTSSGASFSTSSLVSIEQLRPIYISFSVPQTVFNKVAQSQAKAPLEVSAYSPAGKLLEKGKLTVINNHVSTATGTVTLQATFVNEDNALWPGEYVSVQLLVGILHNVVTVPASAIMAGPNGDYVYVVGDDNKVTRVDVQEAARRGGISMIANGVSVGQAVVTTGQYRLDNGTVVVKQTQAPQAQN